jgi:hypothetical protein
MIMFLITNETIDTFIAPFEGKLHNVLFNLAQILTNNPLWIDFNTRFFYYFLQVGLNFAKQNKHPYANGKLI